MISPITPCLWFDSQAEEAANFYVSVFPDSAIESVSHYNEEGFGYHGKPSGSVMAVGFRINGQPFTALNGGSIFKLNEAVSFQIFCDTQDEIDYYWEKLTEGGKEVQCGWLKDKFGVSWRVVPSVLPELMADPKRADKVTAVYMEMVKFDIDKLKKA